MANGQVSVTGNYVSVGLRFVALLIDNVVMLVLAYLIGAVTGSTTAGGFELTGAPAFVFFLLYALYFWLLEAFLGGTLGKLILGMRVRMEDGSNLTVAASLIRNLLRIIDALPFAYILGAILIWTSPTRQRLGDRLAKSVVVKKYQLPGLCRVPGPRDGAPGLSTGVGARKSGLGIPGRVEPA